MLRGWMTLEFGEPLLLFVRRRLIV